jgi:hypothetical protein
VIKIYDARNLTFELLNIINIRSGTECRIATHLRQYRLFKKARAFVHILGLKSGSEWRDYCKSGKKPDDIPAKPNDTYADAGWAGMGDWLGPCTIAPRLRRYRSFDEARGFIRGLSLKSQAEWHDYCKSGRNPEDIPAIPRGAPMRKRVGPQTAIGLARVIGSAQAQLLPTYANTGRSRPVCVVIGLFGRHRLSSHPLRFKSGQNGLDRLLKVGREGR